MRDERGAQVLVDGETGEHVGAADLHQRRDGRDPPRSSGVRSSPSSAIEPAVGATRPLIARSSVVLPAPLVPSTATVSPGATSRSSPNSTCTRPYQTSSSRTRSNVPAVSSTAPPGGLSAPATSRTRTPRVGHGGRWSTTSPLRSEASRSTTVAARSSGSNATMPRSSNQPCGSSPISGVATAPGHSALMRMPRRSSSPWTLRTSPMSDHLVERVQRVGGERDDSRHRRRHHHRALRSVPAAGSRSRSPKNTPSTFTPSVGAVAGVGDLGDVGERGVVDPGVEVEVGRAGRTAETARPRVGRRDVEVDVGAARVLRRARHPARRSRRAG